MRPWVAPFLRPPRPLPLPLPLPEEDPLSDAELVGEPTEFEGSVTTGMENEGVCEAPGDDSENDENPSVAAPEDDDENPEADPEPLADADPEPDAEIEPLPADPVADGLAVTPASSHSSLASFSAVVKSEPEHDDWRQDVTAEMYWSFWQRQK